MDATDFGRVAVLMGGVSAEREISLQSGQAVHAALLEKGVDAHKVDFTPDRVSEFLAQGYDRAFIMLHGGAGEDGTVQGLLDSLGLPYTGSDVLGCALAMDKVRSKQIWQSLGLPTAAFEVVRDLDDLERAVARLDLPVFIKPSREGSSVGVGRIDHGARLDAVWRQYQRFHHLMVERFIDGLELTVTILNGRALPIICMTPATEFYDYEAKYLSDKTDYQCPAKLDAALTKKVQDLALRAFNSLGCQQWGRVDVMLTSTMQPQLLEVNTVPGMTSHSLVPMAAAAQGMNFAELCLDLLAGAACSGPAKERSDG